jgi:hypothetical protein
MKNSNDTIGNRTRDFPGCSAVPQPTALPAACPDLPYVASELGKGKGNHPRTGLEGPEGE